MELTDKNIEVFMRILLNELNREGWGDIDPHWLVNPTESGDITNTQSNDMEEFLSLRDVFKATFLRFINIK